MNLKFAVLMNFVFDCEMRFHPSKVYSFQNLIGLEYHQAGTMAVSTICPYCQSFGTHNGC